MSNLVDPKYTDPKSWGPHFWFMMFCIANNYPENPTNTDRNVTHGFFSNMQSLIPCNKCKGHYIAYFRSYPITAKLCCRKCLISWVESLKKNMDAASKK
jgi:hypothetical protein